MTDVEIKKFILNELKNPMSFDYFVGHAMAKNDSAMMDVLNDFKLYGTLPDVAIQRDKDGKVVDVETTKPLPNIPVPPETKTS